VVVSKIINPSADAIYLFFGGNALNVQNPIAFNGNDASIGITTFEQMLFACEAKAKFPISKKNSIAECIFVFDCNPPTSTPTQAAPTFSQTPVPSVELTRHKPTRHKRKLNMHKMHFETCTNEGRIVRRICR
jgi:hypothetical protein